MVLSHTRRNRAGRLAVAVVVLAFAAAADAQGPKILHYGVYNTAKSQSLGVGTTSTLFDGFILIDDAIGRWGQQTTDATALESFRTRMKSATKFMKGKTTYAAFVLGGVKGLPCYDWGKGDAGKKAPDFLKEFAAKAAAAGMTGVCLDTEAYVDHYWSSGDTGVTHQKAREVGKSFGEAVWGGFPTCELLVMHGGPFDIVNLKDKDAEAKARAKFDLHPSFLVGLLEALDKNGGKGELHLLLESSYDGTLGGQFYDDKVKEVYAGIKAKANELKADKAAAQWKKGNCTIALGAWPLGAFADKLNGPNKVNYSADSFGTQLDAFKAQMTCLGAKPDSPGPPKYVWVYGEANAWLETKAEVRAPYTKKITERWPGKVTAPK